MRHALLGLPGGFHELFSTSLSAVDRLEVQQDGSELAAKELLLSGGKVAEDVEELRHDRPHREHFHCATPTLRQPVSLDELVGDLIGPNRNALMPVSIRSIAVTRGGGPTTLCVSEDLSPTPSSR